MKSYLLDIIEDAKLRNQDTQGMIYNKKSFEEVLQNSGATFHYEENQLLIEKGKSKESYTFEIIKTSLGSKYDRIKILVSR